MCTLSFQGKGYSPDFVRNYKKIAKILNDNEDTLIEVAGYMDDICSACPNKIDEIICKTQDKIMRLDAAHSSALELKTGETLSWRAAKERIKKYMSLEKFHLSCQGCSWKKYGVCQKALEELQQSI